MAAYHTRTLTRSRRGEEGGRRQACAMVIESNCGGGGGGYSRTNNKGRSSDRCSVRAQVQDLSKSPKQARLNENEFICQREGSSVNCTEKTTRHYILRLGTSLRNATQFRECLLAMTSV